MNIRTCFLYQKWINAFGTVDFLLQIVRNNEIKSALYTVWLDISIEMSEKSEFLDDKTNFTEKCDDVNFIPKQDFRLIKGINSV